MQDQHNPGKTLNTMTIARDRKEGKSKLGLTGVPETMLWTLHIRDYVARRKDITWFHEKTFGKEERDHAIRSAVFNKSFLEGIAERNCSQLCGRIGNLRLPFIRPHGQR